MKTWPSSHLILTTPDEEKPANSTLYISMSTVSNTQIPHVVNTFHVSPSLACNQRYRPQTAASQAQYTTCMEHQHNMSLHLRSSLIFGGFDEWLVSQVNSVSGPTGRAGGCVGFVRGRGDRIQEAPGSVEPSSMAFESRQATATGRVRLAPMAILRVASIHLRPSYGFHFTMSRGILSEWISRLISRAVQDREQKGERNPRG